MANVTYVFGDLLTGQVISEIPLFGVSMAKAFSSGEFRGSFQLDMTGKDNADLVSATIPGKCYVVCEVDSQPMWGGVVWTRTYQSQAKVFQLYCKALEHYPERRLVRSDLTFSSIEQMNIFRSLWSSMLTDPNSIQLTIPSSFPTIVTRSLEVKASEFKNYRELMDEIANADDGFDWSIDWNRIGGAYTKTLRMGYPYLGSPNIDTAVRLDYPGSVTNYWQNDSMAGTGTHIFGIGSGEGSTMLTAEVIHDDLVDNNFPRYDVDVSLKGINDLTRLTNLTIQAARLRKAPGGVLTIETKADQEPVFGGYGLGDTAVANFQDPRHPEIVGQTFVARIIGWEYVPASDESVSMARLVLEGDDL